MGTFIEWLTELGERDTKVRAVLRRSLAFKPSHYAPSFPYVEPFVGDGAGTRRREVLYLVAGLWALHKEEIKEPRVPLGVACARHQKESGFKNTERRFIALLDADWDQLPYRLRHLTSLLKAQPLDFNSLLVGLLRWEDDQRSTQNAWARDFYRTLDPVTKEKPTKTENPIKTEMPS